MHRKRLWQLPCPSRAAVLWTSFTWEELLAISDGLGIELELCRLPDPTARATAVIDAVHFVLREPGPLSDRLEDHLDQVHEATILRISAMTPEEVLGWCPVDLASIPEPLAALVWAVVSDEREEMRPVEDCLFWRLYTQGLRALAFGKVEVIGL